MYSPPAPRWFAVLFGMTLALMTTAGFTLMAVALWQRFVEPRLPLE